ncbi:hypothetical protein BDV27DRAFT_166717 [Aspergillus caelatus]|uniref:Fungal-type protein kinase domain-containing protein n=1 Tax=Aspergillus caelatus TaxID=61420 RepID=A0A5N6ZWS8_9EURO|nr:uncharacterized protein BDV27DRAFT_166717 [Aspergillus caelatus]KAE8361713.1 hypothetical protein BDV27DRAFT_166717 [Aspergillus caelatus]
MGAIYAHCRLMWHIVVLQNLSLDLISALQALPASRALRSVSGSKNLFSDLLRLSSTINSDNYDLEGLIPLFAAMLNNEQDEKIWDKVYAIATESTTPPTTLASPEPNSEELDSIYIGVPGFFEAYFGGIDGLDNICATVGGGWRDWPNISKEKDVLAWLTHLVDRKLDVGFICQSDLNDSSRYHWSHVLVLGELKSNPSADTASRTWRDLGRYAREVLTIQDTRRFTLGFTLCGPNMRLWEFDRVGAMASSSFDINKDGLQFVSATLGFLTMNDEQLGYDPSIISTSDGKSYIEIQRDGHYERLILEGLMKRSACVAGRATTCWKARREGDKTNSPLVIKASWQYPEREEEGKLLQEATEKEVVNVARYYYHETVRVNGEIDNIRNNVRKGLDVTQSTNFRPMRYELPSAASGTAGIERTGRSTSTTGQKRSSSQASAILPPKKRPCSSSPSKSVRDTNIQDRVHRRVIVKDYGLPIYRASSRVSLLRALENCIEGYQSLHTKAGLLQGDVSTGNLILNEDVGNPSWSAFLIDLDLSIENHRERPSGARGKTGTRAFMAIGLLLGEQHSFRHDLESFFWVLFWICIHYNGLGQELARSKQGIVADEEDFVKIASELFSPYYQALVPWVNRLRRVVFPGGMRRKNDDTHLYSQMKNILQEAVSDPKVGR